MRRRRTLAALAAAAALGTFGQAVGAGTGSPGSDEFSGSRLTPGWQAVLPPGSSLALGGGELTLAAAAQSRLEAGVERAPLLLQPCRPGPFVIGTDLPDGLATAPLAQAGVIVYRDASNWLLWGPMSLPTPPYAAVEAAGVLDGRPLRPPVRLPGAVSYVELARTGDRYTFYTVGDAGRGALGSFVDRRGLLHGARCGLALRALGAAGSATFDFFEDFAPSPPRPAAPQVAAVADLGLVTGPQSPNNTGVRFGTYGMDLGSMTDMGGRLYLAFGDNNETAPVPGADIHSSMAVTTPSLLMSGRRLLRYTGPKGRAAPLIPAAVDSYAIPTALTHVGSRLVAAFMHVERWGVPNHWDIAYSFLATSDDQGRSWRIVPGARWSAPSSFLEDAFLRQGGYIYIYGTSSPRYGHVELARARPADLLRPQAWEYYAGGGRWARNPSEAVPVVPAPCGEFSVAYDPYLHRYLFAYLDPYFGTIDLRLGAAPEGPFGPPMALLDASAGGLYAPFLNDHLMASGGKVVFFLVSRWADYNVHLFRLVFR